MVLLVLNSCPSPTKKRRNCAEKGSEAVAGCGPGRGPLGAAVGGGRTYRPGQRCPRKPGWGPAPRGPAPLTSRPSPPPGCPPGAAPRALPTRRPPGRAGRFGRAPVNPHPAGAQRVPAPPARRPRSPRSRSPPGRPGDPRRAQSARSAAQPMGPAGARAAGAGAGGARGPRRRRRRRRRRRGERSHGPGRAHCGRARALAARIPPRGSAGAAGAAPARARAPASGGGGRGAGSAAAIRCE